ncbi:MAG: protein kinase [Elusimicrobia bacterium]|nr:protein kinase [Elusimicrobiota bacterium]
MGRIYCWQSHGAPRAFRRRGPEARKQNRSPVPLLARGVPGPAPSIPGYVLTSPLGRGAYAQVWKAWQARTRKWVAVKVFIEKSGVNWLFLQREVERLIRLDKHPHVVSLLDADLTGETPYYVMDYLEKGSLDKFVHPTNVASPKQASQWMREIAEALSYVHSKGLIHCDLKPANILLDDEDRIRVADFGQSRILTESAGALGTLFYMAPEPAVLATEGEQVQPDVRWDIYALGATMYSVLTGKVPYEECDRSAIEAAGSLGERLKLYRELVSGKSLGVFLRLRARGVDEDISAIVERCGRTELAERYPAAEEVMRDLEARTERRPVTGLAHSRLYRLKRFCQRNAAAVGVAAVGLLCLGWAAGQILQKQAALAHQLKVSRSLTEETIRRLAYSHVIRARQLFQLGDELSAASYLAESNRLHPTRLASGSALEIVAGMIAPVHVGVLPRGLQRIEVSPDGRMIAAHESDGISFLEGKTSKVLGSVRPSDSGVTAALISPDWKTAFISGREIRGKAGFAALSDAILASIEESIPFLNAPLGGSKSPKRIGRFFSIPDGKPLGAPFPCAAYESRQVQFSRNSRAFVCVQNDTMTLWDPTTGKRIGKPMRHDGTLIRRIAFSPDHRFIVSIGFEDPRPPAVKDTARTMRWIETHDGMLFTCPGAAKFVPLTEANHLAVWDAGKTERIDKQMDISAFHGAQGAVFSPDGATLVTWGNRGLAFWGFPGGRRVDVKESYGSEKLSFAIFSPDGAFLFVGGRQGFILDARSRKMRGSPLQCGSRPFEAPACREAAFSADGALLLARSADNRLRLWDVPNGSPIGPPLDNDPGSREEMFHENAFFQLSHDGAGLLASPDGRDLWHWATANGTPRTRWIPQQIESAYSVNRVRFINSGSAIAYAVSVTTQGVPTNNRILLYDVKPGRTPLRRSAEIVLSQEAVDLDPAGNVIIKTSSHSVAVQSWDENYSLSRPRFSIESSDSSKSAYSQDGSLILTGSDPWAIWDARTGKRIRNIEFGRFRYMSQAQLSPDAKLIAFEDARNARLWDVPSSTWIGRPMPCGDYCKIAWRPDSKAILTTGQDRKAWLWDLDGNPIGTPLALDSQAWGISFSPDSRTLALATRMSLALWDIETGENFLRQWPSNAGLQIEFSPDGRYLLTRGGGTDSLWELSWLRPMPFT